MISSWWQSVTTKDSWITRSATQPHKIPQERHACWRGLSLEVIPSSPYFKRSVNYQFQTVSDCQHKVERKKACVIQLTSTSLNLHANSQRFVSAPKIKAIAWLALPIILFSSELEGNLEVIISNPLILQIRKLNKAKRDKVASPSSQSHFSEKVFFWFLVMILVLCNHSEHREWERKVPQGMGQGFTGGSHIRGRQGGQSGASVSWKPGLGLQSSWQPAPSHSLHSATDDSLSKNTLGFFLHSFWFDVAKYDV